MRGAVVVTLVCLSIVGLATAENAGASIRRPTHIAAQPLGEALKALANERGFQVLYLASVVGDTRTAGANGDFNTSEALDRILSGTGFTYKYLDETTVTIVPLAAAPAGVIPTAPSGVDSGNGAADAAQNSTAARSRLQVAQLAQGANPSSAGVSDNTATAQDGARRVQLEEIVVTAQKKAESIQNVPMALTALSGNDLLRTQSYQLEDFAGKVPGVSLIDYGGAGTQVVIRGITTGSIPINSGVATYIDETPFTAAGPFGGQYLLTPNLDTFDMQRIEVLKGPQGTLYGANSLGGVLKYLTNAPDPSGFAAAVESGLSSIYSGGMGYNVHGMVNVPLAPDMALRVVGYDNYYPGFTDDPSRGITDTNSSRFTGTRASLLYKPTDELSIRVNALYQEKSWNDYPDEDVNPNSLTPIYGNLIQEKLVSEPGHSEVQLYNVTINFDAGFAKLLSTSSYYSFQPHLVYDYPTLNGYTSYLLGGTYGTAVANSNPVQAFTQELRLSSREDRSLQWQAGAYFTNESSNEYEGLFPIDVTTRTILFNYPTNLGAFYIPVHYREYAGFVDVDYHFTPTFDASVGGRYSADDQRFHETAPGLVGGDANFGNTSSEGVFTYSGDLRWRVTSESMLYARVAEGFAPGGPNETFVGSTLPNTYGASTTINYEGGFKSTLLDNRLTIDFSVFDIDWKSIQLSATINGVSGTVNGGRAQSDGVEWGFAYAPLRGLTLDFNGAYTDAHLTEATPASVGGEVGNRLPGVPLWASSAGADYKRMLPGGFAGFAGVDWRFTGSRYSDFIVGSPRQQIPSFGIFDLRTGLETQRWTFTIYGKNVANKIAINYLLPETSNGGSGPQDASLYMPRTIGATAMVKF